VNSLPALIEIDKLCKTYNWGKIHALNEVDLQISEGEAFGLIGPNGAGKTTLMGCLLAVLNPTSGTIRVNGKSPDDLAVRKITGFLPERPHFDAWMKVHQFLRYHQLLSRQPSSNSKKEIEEALVAVGLDPAVSRRGINSLSRGMLQRLGLAQVLIGKPKLCFLDEPTSGMDPLGMELVRTLLVQWKKQGVTVILNSHHLDEVAKVCERVAYIKGGKIEALEDLSSPASDKVRLIIKWTGELSGEHRQALPAMAEECSARLDDLNDGEAKFSLFEKDSSARLIRALVMSGITVEEAIPERKRLHDLFSSSNSSEAGKS
jgi:ABC-2 type transport system ATP-binding protein